MKGAKDMAKSFSLVAVDEILAIYQEKRKDITVHHSIVDEKTLDFMKNFIKLNEKYLKDC